jgi:hypothetical protein
MMGMSINPFLAQQVSLFIYDLWKVIVVKLWNRRDLGPPSWIFVTKLDKTIEAPWLVKIEITDITRISADR